MSAPGPLGRTRCHGEDLRRRSSLARLRERLEGQTPRRRPFPGRRAVRRDRTGVEELPQRVWHLADITVLRCVGADAAVAFVADLAEGLWIGVREAVEHAVQGLAHGLDGYRGVVVGAAQGLRDDLVHDPTSFHVCRRQLERFGGLGRPAGISEDYGSARLGSDYGEVGVLEHTD